MDESKDPDNFTDYSDRLGRLVESTQERLRLRRRSLSPRPARLDPLSEIEDAEPPKPLSPGMPTTPRKRRASFVRFRENELLESLTTMQEALLAPQFRDAFSDDLHAALEEFWALVNTTLDPEMDYALDKPVFDPKHTNLKLGVSLALGGYLILLTEISTRGLQSRNEADRNLPPGDKVGQGAAAKYLREIGHYVGEWLITDTSASRLLDPSAYAIFRKGSLYLVNLAMTMTGPLLHGLKDVIKKVLRSDVLERGMADVADKAGDIAKAVGRLKPSMKVTVLAQGGSTLHKIAADITADVDMHIDKMTAYSFLQIIPYATLATIALLEKGKIPNIVAVPLRFVRAAAQVYTWWDLSSSVSGMMPFLKGSCDKLAAFLREYEAASKGGSLLGRAKEFATTDLIARGQRLHHSLLINLHEAEDYGMWIRVILWAMVILFLITISVSWYKARRARRQLRDFGHFTQLTQLSDKVHEELERIMPVDSDESSSDTSEDDDDSDESSSDTSEDDDDSDYESDSSSKEDDQDFLQQMALQALLKHKMVN